MSTTTHFGEGPGRWTQGLRHLRDYAAAVVERLKDFAPYAL
jgi:hypothetical protein